MRDLRLGYGSAAGSAVLRARVGQMTGVHEDQVITTQGVALGLYLLAVEHFRAGDEVLIVTPMFPPTRDAMIGSGVTVNTVPLSFDTGYQIDAAEAYRIGLVQEVVEPGAQVERAIALAREMLQCAPIGLVHTIANAQVALDADEPTAIAAIPAMSAAVQSTADFAEGIASFLERRPARFTGR